MNEFLLSKEYVKILDENKKLKIERDEMDEMDEMMVDLNKQIDYLLHLYLKTQEEFDDYKIHIAENYI